MIEGSKERVLHVLQLQIWGKEIGGGTTPMLVFVFHGGLVFFPSLAASQKETRAHAKPRCGRWLDFGNNAAFHDCCVVFLKHIACVCFYNLWQSFTRCPSHPHRSIAALPSLIITYSQARYLIITSISARAPTAEGPLPLCHSYYFSSFFIFLNITFHLPHSWWSPHERSEVLHA